MLGLSGTNDFSIAFAVSSDGSFIVGRASFTTSQEAFRWTNSEGLVGLGYVSTEGDFISSTALDVSAGGSVVGRSQVNLASTAFIWDDTHGMRDLNQVLVDLGLDLTGWTLTEATGISDDGLTIVGTGINPDGNTEAFIARLPEPSTFVLAAIGLTGLLVRRRIEI